jgi:hypothetical protein
MPHVVTGYHGTTQSAATALLAGSAFLHSKNLGDWLGSGAYFFEDAPLRAFHWAQQKAKSLPAEEPVVLRATIRLDQSLDLLEQSGSTTLAPLASEFRKAGLAADQSPLHIANGRCKPPPLGTALHEMNKLDRLFLDWSVEILEEFGEAIEVIRAPFLWGRAVMRPSFLFDWGHVQICVRRNSAITDLSLVDTAFSRRRDIGVTDRPSIRAQGQRP